MRLRPFTYHQPTDLDTAIGVLSEHGTTAAPIAGGTELLLLMKMGLAELPHLVNLKRIGGLDNIVLGDGSLRVGALASHARVAASPIVRKYVPTLAQLCGSIANVRVRNSGSLGGNLCFAEPRADPPVLLAALGATVELVSASGRRRMPVSEFILAPMTTALEPGEILTDIIVPATEKGAGCVRIAGGSHSLATAAVVLGKRAGVWVGHGGGMAALPGAAALTEVAGATPDADEFARAVAADIEQIEINSDIEASEDYRRHLVGVAVKRAALQAAANREGSRA